VASTIRIEVPGRPTRRGTNTETDARANGRLRSVAQRVVQMRREARRAPTAVRALVVALIAGRQALIRLETIVTHGPIAARASGERERST
jgi:hypothetical protein